MMRLQLVTEIWVFDIINLLQAIWALRNVAVDSKHRDHVLQCEALGPLLLILLDKDTKLSTLRIGSKTLIHLCRGTPPLAFDEVPPYFSLSLCFLCLYTSKTFFNIWSMINRWNLHLNNFFIQMMKKSWNVHAWHLSICLKVQKMESKVWLTLVLSQD